jgi:putative intracellular protease/amidase/YHS domain-containing protein
MKRREMLQKSAAFGFLAAMPISLAARADEAQALKGKGLPGTSGTLGAEGANKTAAVENPLKPPAEGVPVAFLISEGAVLIDFVGPWEVFANVTMPSRKDPPFRLYTVSETTNAITAAGGMKIVPEYTLENAPAPKVIVIPAQNKASDAMLEWIRKSTQNTDVTMSVCTGAYVLANTGLLNGKVATTHHASYVDFAMKYPDIRVKRGARFVEQGNLASAGGLSSGMDLAFRVVERYYRREAAEGAAFNLEYQGQGWKDANSNAIYEKMRASRNNHPVCPICGMDVDTENGPKSVYKGKTYYFCFPGHKDVFDAAPEKTIALLAE